MQDKQRWMIPALAGILALPALGQGDGQTGPAANETSRARPPEEVSVRGQKRFSTLLREIREAEDRLYGLFNELNNDDLYDIHCHWEAPLGTRIRERNCRPEFYARATEEFAEGYLAMIRGEAGGHMVPMQAQVSYHYPILQRRMEELTRQHPELLEAMENLTAVRRQLEERQAAGSIRD